MKRTIICLVIISIFCFSAGRAQTNTKTILLLGTDEFIGTVTGEEELSRADAIMVLTMRSDTSSVKLLSIERDYLVTLPGDIGPNKLGTATYFGGPELCVQTVNELLDLDIDLYALVDVSAAEKLIDAMNGIDVEIFASELDIIRYVSNWQRVFTAPGIHALTGAQAVATMRSRDTDIDPVLSDKNRNERQQRVLNACVKKLGKLKLAEFFPVLSALLPQVKTNIAMGDLVDMARAFLGLNETTLEQMRTPVGAYGKRIINMHNVIIVDNMDAEIADVHTFLYGDP